MTKKFFEFISSFGLMILGVGLLFVGSVYVAPASLPEPRRLPTSQPRRPAVGGDIESAKFFPSSRPLAPVPKNTTRFSKDLTAAAALVVDDQTNAVLFDKNSNEVRPLASITKLMSALVLEGLPMRWAETTTIARSDVDTSSHHLVMGETFSLDELWQVALIGSSNSAVAALVRASGLLPETFVVKMNERAEGLRLPTARFTDPTGLDAGNRASAWDTVRLLKEALKSPHIARTLATPEYYIQADGSAKARRVWSTDWLLTSWVPSDFNPEEIVGKTGFISESGYNFAVRLSDKKGHSVRVVVLGSLTDQGRFSEARDLAEWAFEHYAWPDQSDYNMYVE